MILLFKVIKMKTVKEDSNRIIPAKRTGGRCEPVWDICESRSGVFEGGSLKCGKEDR